MAKVYLMHSPQAEAAHPNGHVVYDLGRDIVCKPTAILFKPLLNRHADAVVLAVVDQRNLVHFRERNGNSLPDPLGAIYGGGSPETLQKVSRAYKAFKAQLG